VEKLDTHGGSLRIYGCHRDNPRQITKNVNQIFIEEEQQDMRSMDAYNYFQKYVDKIKDDLLNFLVEQKAKGIKVVAYGAAAKGNTILNYAGIKQDLLSCVYDAASSKQGKYLPGSHIPILHPDNIDQVKPDYILILPWNLSKEIMQQLQRVKEWGCQFVIAIPVIKII
jgi:hypothetical protein